VELLGRQRPLADEPRTRINPQSIRNRHFSIRNNPQFDIRIPPLRTPRTARRGLAQRSAARGQAV
jgi:hypothetical protein